MWNLLMWRYDITKRILLHFSVFISTQPAFLRCNTDLRYHLSQLNHNPEHIACRIVYAIISEPRGEVESAQPRLTGIILDFDS